MVEDRSRCGLVCVVLCLSALACSDKQDGAASGSGETGSSSETLGSAESGPFGDESSDSGVPVGEGGIAFPDFLAGDTGSVIEPDLGARGCEAAPFIDPNRSLIETEPAALVGFTMPAILTRAALSSDLVGDPEFSYARLVDSFSTNEAAALAGGSHCDDTMVDDVASLNGYPIQCPRAESGEVDQLDAWFAVAAVNRFDLASADGSDCGEQRVILARGFEQRMFVIFEARIPNPDPACGIAACRPIVDFWLSLSNIDDASLRNHELRSAFLEGHPDLSAAGFEPFMSGVNLTFGSGQIRTNSFVDEPWTLREFRFVAEDTRLGAVAVPVTGNSHGRLWNDLDPAPQGPDCRASILANLEGLLVDDLARMGFQVDASCFAGESRDDETVDYAASLLAGGGEFEAAIAQRLADLGSDLNPVELANRASFANNCMGCHQSQIGAPLGHGLFGPSSNGFVHVDEFGQISKALADEFLPARADVLVEYWSEHGCDPTCSAPSKTGLQLLAEGPATRGLPDADVVESLRAWEGELLMRSSTTLGGRPRGSH